MIVHGQELPSAICQTCNAKHFPPQNALLCAERDKLRGEEFLKMIGRLKGLDKRVLNQHGDKYRAQEKKESVKFEKVPYKRRPRQSIWDTGVKKPMRGTFHEGIRNPCKEILTKQ